MPTELPKDYVRKLQDKKKIKKQEEITWKQAFLVTILMLGITAIVLVKC